MNVAGFRYLGGDSNKSKSYSFKNPELIMFSKCLLPLSFIFLTVKIPEATISLLFGIDVNRHALL
jgi:hypothetical protein